MSGHERRIFVVSGEEGEGERTCWAYQPGKAVKALSISVITGVPRIGKSLISKEIKRKCSVTYVNTDIIRRQFYGIESKFARRHARIDTYIRLCIEHEADKGLILDGDDFIYRDKNDVQSNETLDLTLLSFLQDYFSVKVFVVGAHKDEDVTAKAQSLFQHSIEKKDYIYSQRKGDKILIKSAIERLAPKLLDSSATLRELSASYNMTYLPVLSSRFEEDVRDHANFVIKSMNWSKDNSSRKS